MRPTETRLGRQSRRCRSIGETTTGTSSDCAAHAERLRSSASSCGSRRAARFSKTIMLHCDGDRAAEKRENEVDSPYDSAIVMRWS